MEFKDIFRNLRESRGKTQKVIAEELGVTVSAVSLWEIGYRTPTFKMLEKIADYFHVSTDYLMGKESEKSDSYYLDIDVAAMADLLHKRPEYKVLFDAVQKVKPEDINKISKMIALMGEENE